MKLLAINCPPPILSSYDKTYVQVCNVSILFFALFSCEYHEQWILTNDWVIASIIRHLDKWFWKQLLWVDENKRNIWFHERCHFFCKALYCGSVKDYVDIYALKTKVVFKNKKWYSDLSCILNHFWNFQKL